MRRRQKLNFLATLFLSQGTPLLLAGDEFGNSQAGNNNAYAQDNETGWLDWNGLEADPEFWREVQGLIRLRRETSLLHLPEYVHGRLATERGQIEIGWRHPDGRPLEGADWAHARCVAVIVEETLGDENTSAAALLINGDAEDTVFAVRPARNWKLAFASSSLIRLSRHAVSMPPLSIACLRTR